MQTPGFFALGAGVWHRSFAVFKLEYFDARFSRVKQAFVFKRASHLTHETACTPVSYTHLTLPTICSV